MVVDQAIQTTTLKPPESGLTVEVKKRRERHAAFALDFLVQFNERYPQPSGNDAAQRRLACSTQTDQGDSPAP
jgi:hypothetical protein